MKTYVKLGFFFYQNLTNGSVLGLAQRSAGPLGSTEMFAEGVLGNVGTPIGKTKFAAEGLRYIQAPGELIH